MKIRVILITFLMMLTLSGCQVGYTSFTLTSTKDITVGVDYSKGTPVKASDLTMFGLPDMKEAVHKAISKAGPEYDLLLNARIRMVDYVIVRGYIVSGTAYSSKWLKGHIGDQQFKKLIKKKTSFYLPPKK